MEDNARIFKEAYRTCKREYDTLQKRYSGVSRKSSVGGLLKWMLPVLVGAAAVFTVLYFVIPAARPTLVFAFICVEAGLVLGFAAYAVYTLVFGGGDRDGARMNKLASIIEELDEAWVANDPNEAAIRRINAEREQRKANPYGVRSRVMSLTGDEGKEK